ncbi:hypothetical protein SAMN05216203_2802 [Marinobacter daqiaonensis]|uniref:Uncharacterized protein n=1 Tax=Marinobacter daqiaonensis TaxID=650891 RepID=A0A1I6J9C3_9GAMM|nr:hypothetical protein SAMN05216203_2802 [Marinobacter daqiaonensis]
MPEQEMKQGLKLAGVAGLVVLLLATAMVVFPAI